MRLKKEVVIAMVFTFCFTTALLMVRPTGSANASYDPWLDYNDDGKIGLTDLVALANSYGTSGTPINKTALLLELQSEVQSLELKLDALLANGTAAVLPDIYESVKDSVVLIVGTTTTGTVQGSGFVYSFSNTPVVITNYHVVHGTTSVSVTFSDGDGYGAAVKGTDPYADLAVLTVDAPESQFKPLDLAVSSALRVGESVIAVGNPYGLVGSLTTGVISALGRTISEADLAGGFAIANIIQTSTPINPGNSGGPLLNVLSKVVGITTAIVTNSQGLGFAVPSNTIQKEISDMVQFGTYDKHSYLGVSGSDMDYATAQSMRTNVTYGWVIGQVVADGPAALAGVKVNDIIIGINGTRIRNGDDMTSYVEDKTLPSQTVVLTVARANQTLPIPLVLGKRPPPPA
jgi:S1-C subfamily serine protease